MILGPSLERQRIGLTEELIAPGDRTAPSVNESESEAQMLWTKLCILAPMALCAAAAGVPVGVARKEPLWRERLEG